MRDITSETVNYVCKNVWCNYLSTLSLEWQFSYTAFGSMAWVSSRIPQNSGFRYVSMSLSINTLRPRQKGRRFADNTFKRIFLNENVRISIKISLKFVPKGPINNNPSVVQIMVWRRSGDKPYLSQWWLVYWRIYASLGLNELNKSSKRDMPQK